MDREIKTFRIGPIRPPSEANSLLLQVTEGCTWNRCKFCELYKNRPFRVFSVDSIKADIDVMAYYGDIAVEYLWGKKKSDGDGIRAFMAGLTYEEQNNFYIVYNWLARGGENVFLQDGNSLALKSEKVVEVLQYLRSKFPHIKRVTTYGRAETLSKISLEAFKELKSAGLDRIHSGFESGSDQVLELIHKGVTAEQEITAGKNIKAAGIEFSVYFMPGVGGQALSEENALGTARVIRAIDPDYVRIRTAVIKTGSQLWEEYKEGSYVLCSDNEKLMEIRQLIENLKGCTGTLVSDHIINLLQGINGRLVRDRGRMLEKIDAYFALPIVEQKIFQLARRSGMAAQLEDVHALPPRQIQEWKEFIAGIEGEKEWNETINGMIENFI